MGAAVGSGGNGHSSHERGEIDLAEAGLDFASGNTVLKDLPDTECEIRRRQRHSISCSIDLTINTG
jgi:hypothetical protein